MVDRTFKRELFNVSSLDPFDQSSRHSRLEVIVQCTLTKISNLRAEPGQDQVLWVATMSPFSNVPFSGHFLVSTVMLYFYKVNILCKFVSVLGTTILISSFGCASQLQVYRVIS